MEISINELRSIVRTLPIGLYAKRGVAVAIGEKDDTSYYSPNTDEIVVSYPQICLALSKVPQNSPHKERIVRGILYHEVSHAFMTPQMRWDDIINVFEDERMETLLANYYHNVDFKSNVYLFNGLEIGQVPPATDKFTAFYNLVRFRVGKPEMLKRVEEIIEQYKGVNKSTSPYNAWEYYYAIKDLYNDTEIPQEVEMQTQDYQSDVCFAGEGETATDMALSEQEIRQMFDAVVNNSTDPSLLTFFQNIINGFNKKNCGGSAIGGYSGVLNPRSVGRNDWKIFERPFTERANNAYGTFHLNLFIDRSGSFCSSQKLVNQIISSLSLLEKKNPNFTLDLVFCGIGEKHITDPRKRVLLCSGGNNLDDNIYEIYRSLQKPSTYNYNIVLFDGDAFSASSRKPSVKNNNFRAFDFANCTIISDEQNQRYIQGAVHRAKVIYTTNYTDELLNNLKTVLARAFR